MTNVILFRLDIGIKYIKDIRLIRKNLLFTCFTHQTELDYGLNDNKISNDK